jgi:hypothetical protein
LQYLGQGIKLTTIVDNHVYLDTITTTPIGYNIVHKLNNFQPKFQVHFYIFEVIIIRYARQALDRTVYTSGYFRAQNRLAL